MLRFTATFWVLATFVCVSAFGQVTIDNGLAGDGSWEVGVRGGGEADFATLNPVGSVGPSQVLYEYLLLLDPGADGGGFSIGSTVTTPATLSDGQVVSSGSFPGPNGSIDWTSTSSIAPGTTIFQNALTFSSSQPFGTVRVISYLDEDVPPGVSNDILIVLGTPGGSDFQLLTLDQVERFGVAQSAGFTGVTGATYAGWAADEYRDLLSAIEGPGTSFSIAGVVDQASLPPTTDPDFPGDPVFGPKDITSALAFDLNPNATSASFIFSLGGAPTAAPPGPTPKALLPFDTTGDLFVLDDGCGCILRITQTGELSVHLSAAEIRSVTGADSVVFADKGLAFAPNGNLFFTEGASRSLLKQQPDGTLDVLVPAASFDDALAPAASFDDAQLGEADPEAVTLATDGFLYVTEDASEAVYRVHPQVGTVTLYLTADDFLPLLNPGEDANVEEILIAGEGVLYIGSNGVPPAIFAVDLSNNQTSLLTRGLPLVNPNEAATRASDGTLIVGEDGTDVESDLFWQITPDGEVREFLSRQQIEGVLGMPFNVEAGIAFDYRGNFFMADEDTDQIIRFDGISGQGAVWVSEAELEAATGFAPDLEGEIAFAPAERAPGPFLPPDPDDDRTRDIYEDNNQNDTIDGEDTPIVVEQQDNVVTFFPLGAAHELAQCLLSNPDPRTGRYQTCTLTFPLPEEYAPFFPTASLSRDPLEKAGSGLLATTPIVEATVTVTGFDSNLRPTELGAEIAIGDTSVETPVTLEDEGGDGLVDVVELELPAPLGQLELRPTEVDTDQDGVTDYLSLGFPGIGRARRFMIPLGDTNGDGVPDAPALDFDGDGVADPNLPLMPFGAGPANPTVEQRLHFAQFGDGAISGLAIFSQITLFNLDTENAANVTLVLKGDDGAPLTVDLNGEEVTGEKQLVIPPGAVVSLKTDGVGPLIAGSVTVTSDRAIGGVILFGGTAGVAGVGVSALQSGGFVANMERNTAGGINTGIAVLNPEAEAVTYQLQLCDLDGTVLATGTLNLAAGGHQALFVDAIEWDPVIDLNNFEGLLKLFSPRLVAATVIQTRPGEFATQPVAPNFRPSSSGDLVAGSAAVLHGDAQTSPNLNQKLYFAQFGDGQVQGLEIFSKLILFNLTNEAANVQLILKDDNGNPLTVDLDGEVVNGQTDLIIPAQGLKVLSTDGVGPLLAGSVTVCSDRALAGVILFGGSAGVAGVGSSSVLQRGFVAPMETSASEGISTGIAVMNLEEEQVTLDLELFDDNNQLLATAQISLAAMGHLAEFLTAIDWQEQPGVTLNFSSFSGLLKVTADGKTAGTVLQTRPGVFATLPAVPPLN